jgi:peroxiredoxin
MGMGIGIHEFRKHGHFLSVNKWFVELSVKEWFVALSVNDWFVVLNWSTIQSHHNSKNHAIFASQKTKTRYRELAKTRSKTQLPI